MDKHYEAIEIKCIECTTPFFWTPGEQKYFAQVAEKTGAVMVPPRRCPTCRAKRKAAQK